MSQKSQVHLVINGQVQGVFFRLRAKEEADKLGLSGWIRNNSDGSVECLAQGDKEALNHFIAWCQTGSDLAQVDDVKVEWQDFTGELEHFKII